MGESSGFRKSVMPLWPIWMGAGLVFLGLGTGRRATVIAGATLAVIGGLFIGMFWWYMATLQRNVERAERELAARGGDPIERMSESEAREAVRSLIEKGRVVATGAGSQGEREIPDGVPESVREFYSAYHTLEKKDGSVVVGGAPFERVKGKPGHWVIDRFDDWSAGVRPEDPRVYHGAEFVEFDGDDSFASMWHYALFALADDDEIHTPAPTNGGSGEGSGP